MTPEVALLVLLTYPLIAYSYATGAWDRARWVHPAPALPAAQRSPCHTSAGERRGLS